MNRGKNMVEYFIEYFQLCSLRYEQLTKTQIIETLSSHLFANIQQPILTENLDSLKKGYSVIKKNRDRRSKKGNQERKKKRGKGNQNKFHCSSDTARC